MIRATFELDQPEAGHDLLRLLAGSSTDSAASSGRILGSDCGLVTLEIPEELWSGGGASLVSALFRSDTSALPRLDRCRLVDLHVPTGLLPGPAQRPVEGLRVGAIIQSSLAANRAAEAASDLAHGGASVVVDEVPAGRTATCSVGDRIRAVADVLHPSVTYFANISGSAGGLLQRAEEAVAGGATGLMIETPWHGIESMIDLRRADLGVPLMASCSTPTSAQEGRLGASDAVVALLTRMAGADFLSVPAFDGTPGGDQKTRSALNGLRRPLPDVPVSVAVLTGVIAADNAKAQTEAGAGGPLVILAGMGIYQHPEGPSAGLRSVCASLS